MIELPTTQPPPPPTSKARESAQDRAIREALEKPDISALINSNPKRQTRADVAKQKLLEQQLLEQKELMDKLAIDVRARNKEYTARVREIDPTNAPRVINPSSYL